MKNNEPEVRLNVLDFLALIAKWYKLFIVNFLLVAIVASIVSLLLPKWYSATAVILPQGGGSGIPSFLSGDLVNVAMDFGFESPGKDIYQTILSSRTIRERLIKSFNLRDKWEIGETALAEDVIDMLNGRISVRELDNKAIAITIIGEDPEFTAELANGCVVELDRLLRDITSEVATRNRIFIEKRLSQIEDSLNILQDSLMHFRKMTKAVSISNQIAAMLEVTSKIEAQILSNDIKLEVMRGSLGAKHPAVAQILTTNQLLKRKFDSIIAGEDNGLFLGLDELPQLSRNYGYILRNLGIQSKLFEYVFPQYENARIQEKRETANVQVLDNARVPEKKFKPQRKKMVMVSCLISIIVTLIAVLFIDYFQTLP
ncbi:MAG: hypothetical protein HQ568_08985, partial [Calditrichaeota bacterium]|nr:hypothetical protein [Calditrichota bacterium]